MKINKNRLIMVIISIFFILSFLCCLGSCFTDDTKAATKEDVKEEINLELEPSITLKSTIAESLQKSAEKCEYISDFCDVLEKNKLFPALDLRRDSLMVYYTYTFDDSSKLEIATKRSDLKIIAVKVVE